MAAGRGGRPAWLFAAPVRPSDFRATARPWDRYNVEVALDRIPAFCFGPAADAGPCLLYDLQTGLEGNWPGRLGSGRGGVYRGRYLKGVGRTPAAANWDAADDGYHGSGHLSVGSALRERLITGVLRAQGHGDTIVGCDAVLVRALRAAERRAVGGASTSSIAQFVEADGWLAAMTLKPADFARPANIVFALDHVLPEPRPLGHLFLDIERFLRPPGARASVEGAPAGIAEALAAAFETGLAAFETFARIGLCWTFLAANVTLDGRFLDLETPTFFGTPFVGVRVMPSGRRLLLGFEEFEFAWHWRLFVQWLRSRLDYLRAPAMVRDRRARRFLDELVRALDATFTPQHLLHDDAELDRRAVKNLEQALDLGPTGRTGLGRLASYAARARLRGVREELPELDWRPVEALPAPAVPGPARYAAPGFLEPRLSRDAEHFAAGIARLSAHTDRDALLRALSRHRTPRT